MKKTYTLGEDLFIAISVILIGMGVIMKLFGATFNLIFATALPRHFIVLGMVSLLYSMALNLQELARK